MWCGGGLSSWGKGGCGVEVGCQVGVKGDVVWRWAVKLG